MAEGADFRPLVCSVYGSLGFHSHTILTLCAERRCGPEGSKSEEYGRTLHLLRARVHAGILDAASLCLLNRRGRKEKEAVDAGKRREATLEEEVVVPWECVVGDCSPKGGHQ